MSEQWVGAVIRERERECACACAGLPTLRQAYIVLSESAGDSYYGAQIYLEKPSTSSHVTGKKNLLNIRVHDRNIIKLLTSPSTYALRHK